MLGQVLCKKECVSCMLEPVLDKLEQVLGMLEQVLGMLEQVLCSELEESRFLVLKHKILITNKHKIIAC